MNETITGHCHCGAVTWSTTERPAHLTRCNCSLCQRIGGLWAHVEPASVKLDYDPAAVVRYIHGDRTLATVSCGNCGCTTHWESLGADTARMGLNANMADIADISAFPIRHFDGADSWTYLD